MPKIEVYTPQVRAQIPGQQRATPQNFGAGVADAMRAQSAQMQDSANIAQKYALEQQALDWNKQVSQFKLDSMKRAEELSNASVPSGKALTDLYNEDFDARAKALNIPHAIKSQAQQDLDSLRVQYVGTGIREQSRRAGIAARENWQQIVTNNANIVALDPSQQDAALTQLAKAAGGLGSLDPETRKALFNDGRQTIRGSVAQSMAQSSPAEFMVQAKAGKWNDLPNLPKYMQAAEDEMTKATAIISLNNEAAGAASSFDNQNVIFDPGHPETKKIAGLVFSQQGGLEAIQQGKEEGASTLMSVVTRTGVVPDNAQGTLRAMMEAGKPEQKAYAFDIIARVQEDAPRALDQFKDREISQAVMYNAMTRRGVDQATALKYVKDSFDPLNKPVLELREENAKKFVKEKATDSAFTDLFDRGTFDWEPGLPRNTAAADSMMAQYREALKTEYLMHGDEDVARTRAAEQVRRIYGVTEAAGRKAVMMYPPENFYAINGLDNGWMKEQLLQDVRALPDGGDVALKNIELLPDRVTAADISAGRLPRYQVLREKNGVWDTLRDEEGKVLYYRFDQQKVIDDLTDKQKQDRENLIRKARIIRDTERGRSATFERWGVRGNPMPADLLGNK